MDVVPTCNSLRLQLIAAEDHRPLCWRVEKETLVVDVMVVLIGDLIGAKTRVSSATCGGIEVDHGLSSVCTLGLRVDFEVNEWEVAPGPKASVDCE